MRVRLAVISAACLLASTLQHAAADPSPATVSPTNPSPAAKTSAETGAATEPSARAANSQTPANGGVAVLPTRDVTIRYRQTEGDGALDGLILSFRAHDRVMRVEQPRPGGAIPLLAHGRYLIVDGKAERTFVVDPSASTYEEMDPDGALAYGVWGGPAERAKAMPGKKAEVAGQTCETWRFEDPDSGPQDACLTRDGVVLRASETMDGKRQVFEAVTVEYGDQDAARFRVPEGYSLAE